MDHKTQLDRIEADVRDMKFILTGNGNPEKGLIVRINRIERDAIRHLWWSRSALGAAITVIVGAIFRLIIHH
jgi:hypothetical protein